jgi:hypothetical protein
VAVVAANRAARDHVDIDSQIRLIVLRRATQDGGVLWRVALRQRGRHAARPGASDQQADLVADRDRAVDPVAGPSI